MHNPLFSIRLLLACCFLLFQVKNYAQLVTDVDGNIYNTITIGDQIWMKENLRVTHYNNLDPIETTVPGTKDITGETNPKYQWAYDSDEGYVDTFGRLYTWFVATDSRGVCPEGMHVPRDDEATALTTYLAIHGHGYNGDSTKIAKSLASTLHWDYDTMPGAVGHQPELNNSSGFSAQPAGLRNSVFSYFNSIGFNAGWWCSTEYSTGRAYYRYLLKRYSYVTRSDAPKISGYPIRCLKYVSSGNSEIKSTPDIHIYPNPAYDQFFVKMNTQENVILKLYSISGELILENELSSPLNEIHIRSIPPGVYVVQLTGKEWKWQRELIRN